MSIDKAKCQFQTKHLRYWGNQPVPVFAFLVQFNWPPTKNNHNIYVINITDHILKKGITKKQTSYLCSYKVLKYDKDIEKFIKEDVPYMTAAKKITEGVVSLVPTISPKYLNRIPDGYCIKYIDRVLEQIRRTSGIGIYDLIRNEDQIIELKEKRIFLTKILEQYKEDPHWEVHYFLGHSYFIDNKYKEAQHQFERSLKHVQSDRKLVQKDWESIKRELRDYIKKCNENV